MNTSQHKHLGFCQVELPLTIAIVIVSIAILLPVTGYLRRHSRLQTNMKQVYGMHQAFVTWSSMSSKGGNRGYYPGLEWNEANLPTPDGKVTGFSGDGGQPHARIAELLNGNFFSPDYPINPLDHEKYEAVQNQEQYYVGVTHHNHSYAMLALPGSDNEKAEWTETLNPDAVVLSDRIIGTGPTDSQSVWSRSADERWRGHAARNDGSVIFTDSQIFANTQYGEGVVNPQDDLFADDPDADDAFLVHEDATTAYSVE